MLLILIPLSLNVISIESSIFTVVGSGVLRIDEAYKVAVTSHTGDAILDLQVSIFGSTSSGEFIKRSQQLQIQPQTTKFLRFRTENFTLGNYALKVETFNFSRAVAISFNPQKVTLMIQMNKPVYKSTDKLDFRVFVMNSRTKPYDEAKASRVWILDARNHELRRWDEVKFHSGVFEESFQFVDLEAGVYEILAEVDGSLTSKTFEIINDARRLFDIVIVVPKLVPFREGLVSYTVDISSVDLHSPPINGQLIVFCKQQRVVKFSQINDTKFTDVIDFRTDLGLHELNKNEKIDIEAVFIDSRLRKNVTGHASFTITLSETKLDLINAHRHFKVGIPYTFTIFATTLDDFPLLNTSEKVFVSVFDDGNKTMLSNSFDLNPLTAAVEIKTQTIENSTKTLKIIAKFNEIQYTRIVTRNPSQARESITLNVLTPQPRLYDSLDFEIITSDTTALFAVFQLVSKGLLRLSKIVPLIEGQAKFSIAPKFSHVPRAHCIAFYVSEDGEIFSEKATVTFDHSFPNFISLEINSSHPSPGDNLILDISSTLNSSVNLLFMEKHGLNTRHRHDITPSSLFDYELMRYDQLSIEDFYDPQIPFWFYPQSFQRKFFEIGAVILTNAEQKIPCKSDIAENAIALEDFESDSLESHNPFNFHKSDTKRHVDGFFIKNIFANTPDVNEDISGKARVTVKLPDVSTTWIISGVALNEQFGIGMTSEEVEVQVMKRFKADFRLPASIKVGEILKVEINLVNLYESPLVADVKFSCTQLGALNVFEHEWVAEDDGLFQTVEVNATSTFTFSLKIKPLQFGTFTLKVIATDSRIIETKVHQLRVLPPGIKGKSTDIAFIRAEECTGDKKFSVSCNVSDENIMRGTLQVEATVVGDIMGLTLASLDELLKVGTGSGEEVLHTFALIVMTVDYLVMTEQLSPFLKVKAVEYLRLSYQKLLQFRNIDGSFSSFTSSRDDSKSLWLTANALRYLRKAERYLSINSEVFIEALAFIQSKQSSNGKFNSENFDLHEIAVTSFIGILLGEFSAEYPQYLWSVAKAKEFVESRVSHITDVYTLAIATYFAFETDSLLKFQLFERLASNAQRTQQFVFWRNSNDSHFVTRLDVKTSAYCLLTLDHLPELYDDAFKVLQWLLVQQNFEHRVQASYEEIVAFEAISRFAARLTDMREDLDVVLGDEEGDRYETAEIEHESRLVAQKYQFSPSSTRLDVFAYGNGIAIVHLTCSFYTRAIQENPAIDIDLSFTNDSCADYIKLNVKLKINANKVSSTLVAIVEAPSGYEWDNDEVKLPDFVADVEDRYRGTNLHIYLREFTEIFSFDLAFIRKFTIIHQGFAIIEVFDFYDYGLKSSMFYKPDDDLHECETNSKDVVNNAVAEEEETLKVTSNSDSVTNAEFCEKCFN